jgi:DNA-binding Lrp family transcriptional regulator
VSKTQKSQLEKFYKIYEQIYYDYAIAIYKIAQKTGISRSSVSRYLESMYEQNILQGPYLRVKPAQTYTEYVYLMQFDNPYTAFQRFAGFPHVLYCALLFGKWNIMVITDKLFDLSQLVGLQEMVYQGKRGSSHTAKVNLISWEESKQKVQKYLENSEHVYTERKKELPDLPWGNQEWKLFSAFHGNMRKKKIPILKEIGVSYRRYAKWKKDVNVYCTSHTGFYPAGYSSYDHHCFLVSTEYEPQIKEIFSFFPTSSFFMEVGNDLMVITSVPDPEIIRWLYWLIDAMKAHNIIKKFLHAQFLLHKDLRGLNPQKHVQRGNP